MITTYTLADLACVNDYFANYINANYVIEDTRNSFLREIGGLCYIVENALDFRQLFLEHGACTDARMMQGGFYWVLHFDDKQAGVYLVPTSLIPDGYLSACNDLKDTLGKEFA